MIPKLLLRFLRGLKFPWLFAVTAVLFGLDILVPDMLPFADELLLGLSTLLLGVWRNKKAEDRTEKEAERMNQSEDPRPNA